MRILKIILAGLQGRLLVKFSKNGWYYTTKADKSKRNNLR